MIDRYSYSVTWSLEDGEYVATCAEFPGLSWLDADRHAALTGLRRLVAEVVDDLTASAEPIPQPTSMQPASPLQARAV